MGCTKYNPRVIPTWSKSDSKHMAYQFSSPAKHVRNMQSELFTVDLYNCLISEWSLADFGQNFWQTGGLKMKREAMRSPKSREVFNSRREYHMYEVI